MKQKNIYFFISIFLSAFLLFQVQPVIARYILPWYGGSAAVWSTCILFFQTVLLAGYAYSHFLTRYFETKKQITIHLVLLALTILVLPITPEEWMKPTGNENPVWGILTLLSLTVGLPYLMLSGMSPLIQVWFSNANPNKSPYRLYSLSNIGSLLGLISYPLIFERYLNLNTQTIFWSVAYTVSVVFCGLTAFRIWNTKKIEKNEKADKKVKLKSTGSGNVYFWLLLSFFGSIIFLSTTNMLTQDIVVVPFLWILPLSMYLLSFIIAFDSPKWYNRAVFLPLLVLFVARILILKLNVFVYELDNTALNYIITYGLGVFVICMVLHGELARLKPGEDKLTLFYLLTSLGGALGGFFIIFIVPVIFKNYWEIYIALGGSIIALLFLFSRKEYAFKKNLYKNAGYIIGVSLLILMGYTYYTESRSKNSIVLESRRNFYGVLKVIEKNKNSDTWMRQLIHGVIAHGLQLMDKNFMNVPLAYYGAQSGIGLAINFHSERYNPENNYRLNVGMIGMGIGTISAFGKENDTFKYYEINDEVEILAKKYFSYVSNSKSKTDVVIGDGRISLERELNKTGSNMFDVLGVDAFSGDAVPIHLLTKEAMDLYLKHLKKDGILAFHISNKYLNLVPVMKGLTMHSGIPFYGFVQKGDSDNLLKDAEWILFTTNKNFISNPEVSKFIVPINMNLIKAEQWTDDYSSILPLFL